jgi:hypothetical protein
MSQIRDLTAHGSLVTPPGPSRPAAGASATDHHMRWSAGAAAPSPGGCRCAEADARPVSWGPSGPTRGQAGAPAGRQLATGPSELAGAGGRGRTSLTPGAFEPGGIPPGKGIGRTAAGCRVPAAPRPIKAPGPSPSRVILDRYSRSLRALVPELFGWVAGHPDRPPTTTLIPTLMGTQATRVAGVARAIPENQVAASPPIPHFSKPYLSLTRTVAFSGPLSVRPEIVGIAEPDAQCQTPVAQVVQRDRLPCDLLDAPPPSRSPRPWPTSATAARAATRVGVSKAMKLMQATITTVPLL